MMFDVISELSPAQNGFFISLEFRALNAAEVYGQLR